MGHALNKIDKIVVLDGYTLNPGDLDWDELKKLGPCEIFDRTPSEQTIEYAVDADVVMTNKTRLTRNVLERLPNLRYIGVLATGYDVVDVEFASERNIAVTHVPDYGTQSVAQMVFAHLLNLTQHVAHHSDTVKAGEWSRCENFCYWDYPLIELEGLTMGILGYGRIGRAVAGIARAFGMRVIAHDEVVQASGVTGVEFVSLEDLFKTSDVLSLHCPLLPETQKIVNVERLRLMKRSAFLINTSRGPLVDQAALADALNNGTIAGAALDVLEIEPPPDNFPLFRAQNCYITPHIAWATRSARNRLLNIAVDNLKAFLNDRPTNLVNPDFRKRRISHADSISS